MGYCRSHAIVVTGSYGDWIDRAYERAVQIFHQPIGLFSAVIAHVLAPTPKGMNGVRSFLIAPDGSKEGWDHSDAGDRARAEFVAWLENQAYDDGSSPLAWVEIQFDDDNWTTAIVNDNDRRLRNGEYKEMYDA